MTVSLMVGAEEDSTLEFAGGAGGAGVAVVTSPVHGGTYAFRYNPSVNIKSSRFRVRAAGGTNRALFQSCRFYLRISTLPSGNNAVLCGIGAAGFSSTAPLAGLLLNTNGTLTVNESGGTSNTSSLVNAFTADNLWHRVEFDVGWNSGAGARVFVDGTQWASFSTVTLAAQVEGLVGVDGFNNTSDVYVDDIIWDNSTLGGSVGYDWKCILLRPVSDPVSLNSWTLSGGGTSNIFDAINNIPYSDTISSSNTIVNAASGGNLDYTPTIQDYLTGGLGVSDIVRSVIAVCRDAEDATTGTKSGGVWIASNPAQAAGGLAFDYGDDGGIAQRFFDHLGSSSASPSVTLGTRPTMTIRKTTSTTRQVDVDFMGVYVEYTPSSSSPKRMRAAVLGV